MASNANSAISLDHDEWDLDADELMELKRRVLKHQLQFLCHNLEFENHYITLKTLDILSYQDVEYIRTFRTRNERMFEMVDKLARGKSEALDVLCYSIKKNRTQYFVARKLEKVYYELVDETIKRKRAMEASRGPGDLPRPGDRGAPPLPWESRA